MTADAHLAAEFYGSARGGVTARVLRERLLAMWPSAQGESLLGIGYAMPYLRLWRDQAVRCIALTPAQMGAARWPPGVPNLSCAAEEDSLPFADLTFDRILLVHGLEMAENARRLLREAWRVLKDDGRLLIALPAPDDLIELRGSGHDRTARTIHEFATSFALADRRRVTTTADLDGAAVQDVLVSIYRPLRSRPAEAMRVTFSLDLLLFHPA